VWTTPRGAAFSPAALLAEQAESLERALWAAVRALEESATLAKSMMATDQSLRARFAEKALTQKQHADVVRRMLLGNGSLTVDDAHEEASAGGWRGQSLVTLFAPEENLEVFRLTRLLLSSQRRTLSWFARARAQFGRWPTHG
jgi:hypothetical protein